LLAELPVTHVFECGAWHTWASNLIKELIMDLGKKIKTGVEAAPIEAPIFNPVKPTLPGFVPDFTPVPVALPSKKA